MKTRTIYYINEGEDYLDSEVDLALTHTLSKNLEHYCEVIIANYAMMNIDVLNYPIVREIYYTTDE